MARHRLRYLFQTLLVGVGTMGGAPCGPGAMCEDLAAGTLRRPLPNTPNIPNDAGDAGDGGPFAHVDPALFDGDGGLVQSRCQVLCFGNPIRGSNLPSTACRPEVGDGGFATVVCEHGAGTVCDPPSGGGRQHAGVEGGAFARAHATADYLAGSAVLEASSVLAFHELRRELQRRGASRPLLRAISRAARDEARHARAIFGLARRAGATTISAPRYRPIPPRTLEEIARENAVEGCVAETYGALLALWQGENARDIGMRAILRRVARDETRHAELSWAMAMWMEQRLDCAARRRVNEARAEAITDLRRRVSSVSAALVTSGLAPAPRAARAMVDGLFG